MKYLEMLDEHRELFGTYGTLIGMLCTVIVFAFVLVGFRIKVSDFISNLRLKRVEAARSKKNIEDDKRKFYVEAYKRLVINGEMTEEGFRTRQIKDVVAHLGQTPPYWMTQKLFNCKMQDI